jgi:hypothetical protein
MTRENGRASSSDQCPTVVRKFTESGAFSNEREVKGVYFLAVQLACKTLLRRVGGTPVKSYSLLFSGANSDVTSQEGHFCNAVRVELRAWSLHMKIARKAID